MIEDLVGKNANVVVKPKTVAGIVASSTNISKAAELLEYTPSVSAKEGVTTFGEWYMLQA